MWRGGAEISLTAREFEVLEFLMRRVGEVVSKHEILAGVWEFDFDGDPNIVEVYVRRLRTRIDEPFDRTGHRDDPWRRLPAGQKRATSPGRARTTVGAVGVVALALGAGVALLAVLASLPLSS